jgi:predicted nucleic acid-binding protein
VILLDSDIAIDYFRGRRAAVELVGALFDRDAIAISAVTLGEFFEGIFYGRDPASAEQSFTQWLEQIAVLSVDEHVAR